MSTPFPPHKREGGRENQSSEKEKEMKLLLSANPFLSNKTLISPLNPHSITLQINPKPFSLKPPPSHKPSSISASLSSPTTTTTTITKPPLPLSNWSEFAKKVSGEWDGFNADFTSTGEPIELPENVVPEAYREWEVQVFDWQTQCPTLASESGDEPILSYKLIRLLPTVGCEADAATRYTVDERVAGGDENGVLGFGYDVNGSYVAVWGIGDKVLEVEHCLFDPNNGEVRVRVVMGVRVEEGAMKLEKVRVFSEQWYGPWRNGEQLGGCSIRESGFALSRRVDVGDVVGAWEGRTLGGARFDGNDLLHELVKAEPPKSVRYAEGIIALPKNLWCSLKEKDNGETWGEVGWLLDRGIAMVSRCVFLRDGTLKEMTIGQEAAVLED